MADAPVSQAPAERPEEEPLDAAEIRSRVMQLSAKWRRVLDDVEAPVEGAKADAARSLNSMYEEADETLDEWDSVSAVSLSGDLGDLEAYLEWLKTEVTVSEEMNGKVSDEIDVETTDKGLIQLDVAIEDLKHSLWKLVSADLSQYEENAIVQLPDSADSCKYQSIVDMDNKYVVLKLDQQIEKSEMDLQLLRNMERADALYQLKSILSPLEAEVLEFKENCLRVFLRAPKLTDSVIYEHKMDFSVTSIASFVSDHELLIEFGEGMELEKVQIFPNDVCVDILVEMLISSRQVVTSSTLGRLIQQIQRCNLVNALRRSLVNDANNSNSSRHSFEYSDKGETIIAHLVQGIDIFIKTSAYWPLSDKGLKLISIHNSGTHPTNITATLLGKAKEVANGLEQQIRRHLVRFVDSVEEILVRELQSGLHAGRSSS